MVKLDHLAIFVTDEQRSARWYVEHLGLRVEFTVPERGTIALQDDGRMTLFLADHKEDVMENIRKYTRPNEPSG